MKMNKNQLKEAVKAVVRECLNERVIKEVSPPGKKAERMIQHVKSSLRQSHPDWDEEKVTSVAIATGWKAHNKGSVEEAGVQGADSKVSVLDVIVRLIMKRVPAYKGNPDKITKAAANLFRLQYGKPADIEAVQQAVERNLGYGDQIQDTPPQDECDSMEQEGTSEMPQGMEGREEGEHAYDEREEIKLIKVMALIAKKLEAMHAGMPGDEVDPSAEYPAAAEEPSEPVPFGGGEEEPSEEPSETPEPKKKEKKEKKEESESGEEDECMNESTKTLPPNKGSYKVVAQPSTDEEEENKALTIQTDPEVNEAAETLPPNKGQYKTVAPHAYTDAKHNKALTIQTDPEVNEGDDKWIQKAVNPKHKGYCTPMTKSTCTPRRKALAMRFKKGDIHKDNVGEAGLTSEADSTPMPKLSELVKTNEDKWIKKAVDPNHTGYCTPMTKSTCTPRRKALAQRFKKGLENENHKVQTRSYTTANDLAQDPNIVRDPEVPGP